MVDESEVFNFESDDYRWLVIKVINNMITAGVFTDIKQIGRHIGTSDATIRRRLEQMNGTGRIKINGFIIQEVPYYKSKRGPSNETKQ